MNARHPLSDVIVSAALFGASAPLAKLLLRDIDPLVLAGLLYMGAFIGLAAWTLAGKMAAAAKIRETRLGKRDIPWLVGSIVAGGIVAPVALLFGLRMMNGFSASLLMNLEGLMTGLIAVFIFGERAGARLWLALAAMTAAGVLLSWDPTRGAFVWTGPLLLILAMTGWGLDNNFTREISDKDPAAIARMKSGGAGLFLILLAACLRHPFPAFTPFLFGLALGAFSYGLSLVLYIRALAGLGAFRTGVFFSLGPFIGAGLAFVLLAERPRAIVFLGMALFAAGAYLVAAEKHHHWHRHGRLVHAHAHRHDDGHHTHDHDGPIDGPHDHSHEHREIEHSHNHLPDIHHRHGHYDQAGREPG